LIETSRIVRHVLFIPATHFMTWSRLFKYMFLCRQTV